MLARNSQNDNERAPKEKGRAMKARPLKIQPPLIPRRPNVDYALGAAGVAGVGAVGAKWRSSALVICSFGTAPTICSTTWPFLKTRSVGIRSEEHTSELQSHLN